MVVTEPAQMSDQGTTTGLPQWRSDDSDDDSNSNSSSSKQMAPSRKRKLKEEPIDDQQELKRQKNREAAKRCREKKLQQTEELTKRNEQLEQENRQLAEEKEELIQKCRSYQREIEQHKLHGCSVPHFQAPCDLEDVLNPDISHAQVASPAPSPSSSVSPAPSTSPAPSVSPRPPVAGTSSHQQTFSAPPATAAPHSHGAWDCTSAERPAAQAPLPVSSSERLPQTSATTESPQVHHIKVKNKDGSIKMLALEHTQYVTLMRHVASVQYQKQLQQQQQQQQQFQLQQQQQQQQQLVPEVSKHPAAPVPSFSPVLHGSFPQLPDSASQLQIQPATSGDGVGFVSDSFSSREDRPVEEDEGCQRLDTMEDLLSVMKEVSKDKAATLSGIKMEMDADQPYGHHVQTDLLNMLQGRASQDVLEFLPMTSAGQPIKSEPQEFPVLAPCALSTTEFGKQELPTQIPRSIRKTSGNSRETPSTLGHQVRQAQEVEAGVTQNQERDIHSILQYLQGPVRGNKTSCPPRVKGVSVGQAQGKTLPESPSISAESSKTASSFVTTTAKVGSLIRKPTNGQAQALKSTSAQTSSAGQGPRIAGFPQQLTVPMPRLPTSLHAPPEVNSPGYCDIMPSVKLREAAFESPPKAVSSSASRAAQSDNSVVFSSSSGTLRATHAPPAVASQSDVIMSAIEQLYAYPTRGLTTREVPSDTSAPVSSSMETNRQTPPPVQQSFQKLVNVPLKQLPVVLVPNQNENAPRGQTIGQVDNNGWPPAGLNTTPQGGAQPEGGEILMSMSTAQIVEYLKYNSMEVLDSAIGSTSTS